MERDETWRVLRAQSGDRQAFDELLAGVQVPLHRYISSLVGDRALADDALQETFLRIYRKLRWLDEPEAFRAWAYRIASREAFRLLKRERRWADRSSDPEALDSVAVPEEPPAPAGLRELMARVSPASRAVLVLHYLEEMPLADVAAVLGVPVGTAKSRLAYGLATLRRDAAGGNHD